MRAVNLLLFLHAEKCDTHLIDCSQTNFEFDMTFTPLPCKQTPTRHKIVQICECILFAGVLSHHRPAMEKPLKVIIIKRGGMRQCNRKLIINYISFSPRELVLDANMLVQVARRRRQHAIATSFLVIAFHNSPKHFDLEFSFLLHCSCRCWLRGTVMSDRSIGNGASHLSRSSVQRYQIWH